MNYSLREASSMIGIKVRTAREWIRNGKLAAKKDPFNKRWFVEQGEIDRIRSKQIGHGN